MDVPPLSDGAVDALVGKAAKGDSAAFANLYDLYAPRLRRFMRHQVGDHDVAEELVQRTFVKMIEALPRYQQRGLPFGAWVFRIARNVVIDNRRTMHPTTPLDALADRPAESGDPAETAERIADQRLLRDAMKTLAPDQREVLVWRFFAQLSPAETAALMERSNGAVRILQHRALVSLRGLLGRSLGLDVEDDS